MIKTTHDIFLKGALTIEQPSKGYRAGTDAVLLAAAAASFPVPTALEAGCGVGTALLSLGFLRADSKLRLTGLEKDEAAWSLAKANAARNPLKGELEFVLGDVLTPDEAMLGQYDLVFSNPPYFDDDRAIRDPDVSRQTAYILGAPLDAWIKGMLSIATPKGRFLMIHRADRLPDILAALRGKAGDIGVCPVRPRAGDPAKRVVVSARKGSRAPLRLLTGIDLHPPVGEGRFSLAYQAICDGGVLAV
ncbi:methyltransferase [Aquidulcibacter sp.]|uniref:tRNA1(Val) (adenine(37)-N6)-methyltransferase n=1 Tax=Aquidulcibacter sp. TaxID=2052990 RepID=UPI0028B0F143|nr:methyltransferase [Aquidulcibacter sp.]